MYSYDRVLDQLVTPHDLSSPGQRGRLCLAVIFEGVIELPNSLRVAHAMYHDDQGNHVNLESCNGTPISTIDFKA